MANINGKAARGYTAVTDAAGNGLYNRVTSIIQCPVENDLTSAATLSRKKCGICQSITEMIPTPLKPIPCNRQVLDAILGAIERHRRAIASLGARKLQQRSLAWRLWGIEYDETIPIVAPEELDWAIIAADIKAAEQDKRALTSVIERVAALLTYFTHQKLHRWKRHAGLGSLEVYSRHHAKARTRVRSIR